MTRRRRKTTRPVLLRGLELLTSTDYGDVLLPGLTISAWADAVAVSGPADQVLRSWSWSEVTELVADEHRPASDGRAHQLLELKANERSHRFLVAAADLSVFLTSTAGWRYQSDSLVRSAEGGGRGSSPTPRTSRRGTQRLSRRSAHQAAHQAAHEPKKARGLHSFVRVKRARHARLLRLRPVPACIGAVVLIAGGATFGTYGTGGPQVAAAAGGGAAAGSGVSIMSRMARQYSSKAADLPAATTTPAPAPPSLASAPVLQSHEIFGFAPYWTLPQSSGFDVSDLTTIAYFSIGVNGDGSIDESGPGWTGYESQDLADLITRAHAAGSRVVLTVTCFGQSALNQLTSDPTAAKQLSTALVPLVAAKNFDGVNFDFEGQGSGDRAGLDSLMAQVSGALRAADPHWQVTMDTYASAADDPGGFYDIAGLAPSVDAFFVMAYDMNGSSPSPTAALTGSGFTDLDALQEYTSVVPASKVILGVPYYGYDWPTTGPALGATATGPKTPLSYSQITAANHPLYWDPVTQTAWTSYQVGSQWHQTWFDDPSSLALKAQLAGFFHIAGLGVWALGMDGNNPAMLAALLGHAPVVKNFLPGPGVTTTTVPGTGGTTSTTTAAGPTYSYTGVWNQSPVTLTPVALASLPDDGEGQAAGDLSDFATDDPADACLTTGGTLAVSELMGQPGVYLVTAQTPPDCVGGTWTFTPDSAAGGGGSDGGGGGSGATTTTTTIGTTTTTTDPGATTTTTNP
jgi:hypothetical protein